MKFDFKNETVFTDLEEAAIDGGLIYDDYPPCEYKYFSKLSKLGYLNRHKGWSAEICEAKQAEFKKQYVSEREDFDRFFNAACTMQENIRRGGMTVISINKAKNAEDKLRYALNALELILCEEGFAKRNLKDLEEQ